MVGKFKNFISKIFYKTDRYWTIEELRTEIKRLRSILKIHMDFKKKGIEFY